MAYLAKGRREDMLVLAEELDLKPDSTMTVKKLKDLIVKDKDYDEEFTKDLYTGIIEKRKAKEELEEKVRLETLAEAQRKQEIEEKRRQDDLAELRRKDEVELERLRFETQLRLRATDDEADVSKLPGKEISKFLHKYEVKEDISLYLILFERQVQRLNIPKVHWVSYLLGLLPPEISHIVAREPEEKANDYEHVKELLLKRFKLTPEKFRQLFSTHQKSPSHTWTDYYHELSAYFNGWISGLKIATFEDLRKLIISDQMKRRAPTDFKQHFLDDWSTINSPAELAEKFEEYEDIKKTLGQNSNSAYFREKQDFKGLEKFRQSESPRKFEYSRSDRKFATPTSYDRHHEARSSSHGYYQGSHENLYRANHNRNYGREKSSNFSSPSNAQANYSKFRTFKDTVREPNASEPKRTVNAKEANNSTETCAIIRQEGLRTKEIMFGNKRITALIDTGSTVSLLRENTSRRIIDPTKLAKNKILLTGIGEAQVTTIGSFEQEFQMDEENYSLVWHVVPRRKLKYEAVIGLYILQLASVNFTKKGVEFVKYENQAFLMQISAENVEKEELNHIRDFEVKKELKKKIENYKPEKTASTMRIILKDNEPVCQSPRRLAFTQRAEVNKQLEKLQEHTQRELLRKDAKKNIEKIQSKNRKTYNKRRKRDSEYKEGDLVAIQRTQFGVDLKLRPKFLGPYKVTKVKPRDRYEVEKIGHHEGPNVTTTSADIMKRFSTNAS